MLSMFQLKKKQEVYIPVDNEVVAHGDTKILNQTDNKVTTRFGRTINKPIRYQ